MIDIELGPIRPPSESQSLLIRVTRGCHWNKEKVKVDLFNNRLSNPIIVYNTTSQRPPA